MRLPHPILSQEWLPSGPPPRQAPCQTAWWHPGTWLPPGGSQLPPAHCAALGRPPGHSAPRFLLRETGPAGVCRGLSRAETCVQLVVSPTEVSLTLGCCPSQGRCCGGGTVGAPARWRAGLRDVGSRQPGRGRRSVLSTRRWPRAACSRLVPPLLLPRRLRQPEAPETSGRSVVGAALWPEPHPRVQTWREAARGLPSWPSCKAEEVRRSRGTGAAVLLAQVPAPHTPA